MGIFSSIKNAIFGKDAPAKPAQQAQPAAATTQGSAAFPATKITMAPSATQKMDEVDVEQRLDSMPGADNLNWRTSIVDLMKLLDIDSSYDNRKELAQELGRSDYDGSADDNLWLHKRTMQELAANGGKVPQKLTD
jgi:hypothetical protein